MQKQPLRVAVEVTPIASHREHAWERTGIHRLVDAFVQQLALDPGVDARLCLPDTWHGVNPESICRLRIRYSSLAVRVPRRREFNAAVFMRHVYQRPIPDTVPLRELAALTSRRLWLELRPLERIDYRVTWLLRKIADRVMNINIASILRDEDVYLSTFYRQIPEGQHPIVVVHFVYDLIPHTHPQFCADSLIEEFRKRTAVFYEEASYICISDTVRSDVEREFGIDAARLFVARPAADPLLFHSNVDDSAVERVCRRYGLSPRSYFLSVATIEPRKNILSTIRAFAEMTTGSSRTDYRLVLAGAQGWLDQEVLQQAILESGVEERIVVTGYVPDEDLAPLYANAVAFVFPSFYEGFGLPVLEAMQCGAPVIVSDRGSLPEVVGDAGIIVDPDDVTAIATAMARVADDEAFAARCREASALRAQSFSWSAFREDVLAALRSAVALNSDGGGTARRG